MKVALIGPTYPFRGGISHYTTLLYAHLQRRYQTLFLTFSRKYPKFIFPGNTSHDSSDMQLSETEAIPIIDWASPFSWFKTGLLVARWSPDMVIFPWWMWGWAIPFYIIGRVVSLKNSATILYICHNVIEHETSFWKKLLSRLALSIGGAFIVHSGQDYEDLKRIFPNARIEVAFHPTYEAFKHSTLTKKEARKKLGLGVKFKKVVLFFGIVRPYKGLIYLIEALPMIAAQIPDLCLVIAGEFWESKKAYLQRIAELQIEDNVRIFDQYVPNEDVATYFLAADLVVPPYISGTGSGIVQIAFGFDKPVIASSVGCLSEVVNHGKTGYVVNAADTDAIVDAVISFYEHNQEEIFAKNIRNGRARFSWDKMVDKIASVC
jgi:glycosyltransferase involved in cell wall biosynthesis